MFQLAKKGSGLFRLKPKTISNPKYQRGDKRSDQRRDQRADQRSSNILGSTILLAVPPFLWECRANMVSNSVIYAQEKTAQEIIDSIIDAVNYKYSEYLKDVYEKNVTTENIHHPYTGITHTADVDNFFELNIKYEISQLDDKTKIKLLDFFCDFEDDDFPKTRWEVLPICEEISKSSRQFLFWQWKINAPEYDYKTRIDYGNFCLWLVRDLTGELETRTYSVVKNDDKYNRNRTHKAAKKVLSFKNNCSWFLGKEYLSKLDQNTLEWHKLHKQPEYVHPNDNFDYGAPYLVHPREFVFDMYKILGKFHAMRMHYPTDCQGPRHYIYNVTLSDILHVCRCIHGKEFCQKVEYILQEQQQYKQENGIKDCLIDFEQ